MRLIDSFDRAVSLHPDRVFVRQGAVSRTYAESARATRAIAAHLARRCPGSARVAVLSPNDYRLLETMYGVMRAGSTLVPLNARSSMTESAAVLRQLGCRALFIHSRFAAHVADLTRHVPSLELVVGIDYDIDGETGVPHWCEQFPAEDETIGAALASDDTWAIYCTSGTTGLPKGVVHSHANIMLSTLDLLQCLRISRPVNHLVVGPLTHMAGLMTFALTTVGATHVIAESADPAQILDMLVREQIEATFMPPTLIYMLLDAQAREPAGAGGAVRRFEHMRSLVYAGAPMAPQRIREALQLFGPVLTNIFAQTELLAPVTCLFPEEHRPNDGPQWEARLASIGRATLSRRVAVMSDTGELLRPGEIGEIVVRSACVMKEYLDDEEATATSRKYGWHHTGDVGFMDVEGYVTLVDRKKDMIVTGGFNVFSAEVERAILAHPAILDVAVIGVPDAKWGEAVKAIVELKADAAMSEEELIAHCKGVLGSVKAPKTIEFCAHLPRSPAGKVLKRELREQYWKGQWRRI